MLGQNTICWHFRKQRATATSTIEAEFLTLSAAAKQKLWLQLALHELRVKHGRSTPLNNLKQFDNSTALDTVDNISTLYGDSKPE